MLFAWTGAVPDPLQPEGEMRQVPRPKQWVSDQLVTKMCVCLTVCLSVSKTQDDGFDSSSN